MATATQSNSRRIQAAVLALSAVGLAAVAGAIGYAAGSQAMAHKAMAADQKNLLAMPSGAASEAKLLEMQDGMIRWFMKHELTSSARAMEFVRAGERPIDVLRGRAEASRVAALLYFDQAEIDKLCPPELLSSK